MLKLHDVIDVLEGWYPAASAESWDAVGLTCGDPGAKVNKVLLAVDCVPSTVSEAAHEAADLLLTHHPLLLSGVHGVPTTDPKGALVHRMIRNEIAHFVAHTNADVADHGVSAALADRLGLSEIRPLEADVASKLDQLTVFVPTEDLDKLVSALATAGAGELGNYDSCTFTVEGTGTYRPLKGASPADGEIGVRTSKTETRLSMVLPRGRREAVIAAMRAAHPYEEVAFELTEQAALNASTGTGRIGILPQAITLRDFVGEVASRLPNTVWGVRAAGDPDKLIQKVAVCGGSGGSYTDLARAAGADVYLTSDLRHHGTVEACSERVNDQEGSAPMALVDAAHWATESPWLDSVAALLRQSFGAELEVKVSLQVTDPWTLHRH
jgi:dinuclear metal center YbgI/SA1388 family protein